jgi:hypothetical protein
MPSRCPGDVHAVARGLEAGEHQPAFGQHSVRRGQLRSGQAPVQHLAVGRSPVVR